jgi:hypothetical protein
MKKFFIIKTISILIFACHVTSATSLASNISIYDRLVASQPKNPEDHITNWQLNELIYDIPTDIEVSGIMPKINLENDHILQENVNQRIKNIFNDTMINAIDQNANKVIFDYYLGLNNNINSLIIKSNYVFSKRSSMSLNSINFNTDTKKIISLIDILGPNALNISNKFILDSTKKFLEKYNPSFEGISINQSFYIDDNNIELIFDDYTFPNLKDIKISMNLDYLNTFQLPLDSYELKPSYNLRMLPLRSICEMFDYNVTWLSEERAINISRSDFNTEIILNRNSYFKNRGNFKALETSPEIINGITYVPISFFNDILGLSYNIDTAGTITFSEYRITE